MNAKNYQQMLHDWEAGYPVCLGCYQGTDFLNLEEQPDGTIHFQCEWDHCKEINKYDPDIRGFFLADPKGAAVRKAQWYKSLSQRERREKRIKKDKIWGQQFLFEMEADNKEDN